MKKNTMICMIICIILLSAIFLLSLLNRDRKDQSDIKVLNRAYDNSKVSNNIDGYALDLRINGNSYNKIIRVSNYKNKDFSYYIYDNEDEKDYVIKDNKTYIYKDNEYIETTLDKYLKPNIYMDTLSYINEASYEKEEVIADKKYKVYKVKFSKSGVNEMLKDTDLDIEANNDIDGKITLDKDNRVYKILFYIDDVTIYASYFGYNNTHSININ